MAEPVPLKIVDGYLSKLESLKRLRENKAAVFEKKRKKALEEQERVKEELTKLLAGLGDLDIEIARLEEEMSKIRKPIL